MHDESHCECEKFLKKGLEAMQKAKWEKAKKNHEKARAVHGDNATAWANLGLCYDQLGDRAKALECYDKTLEYNPGHKHRLATKALCWRKRKGSKKH